MINNKNNTSKKKNRWVTVILIVIASIVCLALLTRTVWREIIIYQSKSANEISEMVSVELGGIKQNVLIEGKFDDLPVLIAVHGGPGTPIPMGCAYRGVYNNLSCNYIFVQWDQYGCGINKGELDETFSVERYTDMLCDLVSYLTERFPSNDLYLFGMSWGTVLTCKVANDMPDIIDGVIAYGQIVDNVLAYKNAYEVLNSCELTDKERKALDNAMENTSNPDFLVVYDLMCKYTNGIDYNGEEDTNTKFYTTALYMLVSPDYSVVDIYNALDSLVSDNGSQKLYEEINTINMKSELERISIPYHIVQGADDLNTPTDLVEDVIDELDNDFISYTCFDNSGHIPTDSCWDSLMELIEESANFRVDKSLYRFFEHADVRNVADMFQERERAMMVSFAR